MNCGFGPLRLASLALAAPCLGAAQPQVSNRPARADEVGYRPADGSSVRLNPPSFIWLHEPEAQSYAIQCARQRDFGDAVTASDFQWNTYTHHTPLAPGTYFWRYRFVTKAGVTAKYLCPLPLSFRQWDGYDPKPTQEFPNQWHVEAGTSEKRSELGTFTLIVPHRAGQRTEWKAERIETDTAAGVRIKRGGRQTLIAFRKQGTEGDAALAGQRFTGPLLVR